MTNKSTYKCGLVKNGKCKTFKEMTGHDGVCQWKVKKAYPMDCGIDVNIITEHLFEIKTVPIKLDVVVKFDEVPGEVFIPQYPRDDGYSSYNLPVPMDGCDDDDVIPMYMLEDMLSALKGKKCKVTFEEIVD